MPEHMKQPPSSGWAVYRLAYELMEQISPGCNRIVIAGSIRRGKPDPGDIEFVCTPSLSKYEVRDIFDEVRDTRLINRLNETLAGLLRLGQWALDDTAKRNGPKHKRLKHVATGIACDLFITDAARWGYTFCIRTGPSDFSQALVTRALNQGRFFKDCLLHNHAPEWLELPNGKRETKPCPSGDKCVRIIATPEETDIFTALRLPYIAPENRAQADFRAIAQG